MASFWHQLPKPFLVLAPMEDVTDTVFRQIISGCGRPHVLFTEFTNCEGIQSAGQARVIHRLKYDKSEHPIVAQVWGITPEDYYKTAKLIRELGFDGIDINMGCPVKKVIKMGACSALIKNHALTKEIMQAVREGAGHMAVSIKTRIGFSAIQTEEWIGFLLSECRPDALTIHGRTVKEESKVPCHWDEIAKAVTLRDEIFRNVDENFKTIVIGNGDIQSHQEASLKAAEFNLDGVMIGRGVFKNPWIFNPNVSLDSEGNLFDYQANQPIGREQRLELLVKHVKLWQETWVNQKNFAILKKYFKIYASGFAGSGDLRARLMETKSVKEVLNLIES